MRIAGRKRGIQILMAVLAGMPAANARGATVANWSTASSGNWPAPSKWSTNPNYPNNGTPAGATYEAVIDATGANYTVSLLHDTTVDRVTLNSANATINQTAGVLQAGVLDLRAGTFQQGSVIRNTQIIGSGGTLNINGVAQRAMDNVVLDVPVQVAGFDALYLYNGLTLNSTFTFKGTTESTSPTAVRVTTGPQTIEGSGEILFTTAEYSRIYMSSGIGSLTLGAGLTIRTTTGSGAVQCSSADALISNATVISNVSGKTISFLTGTATNNGTITAGSGGGFGFMGNLTNNGSITISGGVLNYGGYVSGPGTFSVTNSAINLIYRTFTPAEVLAMPSTGNSLTVVPFGTIDLGGGELQMPAALGNLQIRGGTVMNGRLSAAPGVKYLVGGNDASFLDGVTLAADLEYSSFSTVRCTGNLMLDGGHVTFRGGVMNFTRALTLGGTGTLTFNNSVPGALGGTLAPSLSGSLTIAPGITVETGNSGGSIGASSLATINQGRLSSRTSGRTVTFAGNITNQGTIEAINGGLISGSGTFANSGTVSIAAGSTLTSGAPLTWSGGSIGGDGAVNFTSSGNITADVSKPGRGVLRIGGSFSLGAGKRLDLTEGKLVLSQASLGSFSGGSYSGVQGLVQAGYDGGGWDGVGIVTSAPDALSGLTTIAVATAGQVGYAGGTFGGVSVSSSDVLVMYTWAGDADLNGELNGDDYFYLDSNVLQNGLVFGFHNGDFNYDGELNGDDYFILDSNILQAQASPPFPTGLGAGALASVPEPGSLSVLVALAALGRRTRRGR